MAKFLIEASYTRDGVKGVQSAGGSSRRDAVAKVAESVGGSLESFYFGFGDADAYVLVDLPDNEAAAAVALTVNAAGGATTKTTVLMTPEEVDDHVCIGIAEPEVEALERSADALGNLRHGVAPAAPARALDALDALRRVGGFDEELRHEPSLLGYGPTLSLGGFPSKRGVALTVSRH